MQGFRDNSLSRSRSPSLAVPPRRIPPRCSGPSRRATKKLCGQVFSNFVLRLRPVGCVISWSDGKCAFSQGSVPAELLRRCAVYDHSSFHESSPLSSVRFSKAGVHGAGSNRAALACWVVRMARTASITTHGAATSGISVALTWVCTRRMTIAGGPSTSSTWRVG